MKHAQLLTVAGLMALSSGFASATTMTFQGVDAARSATVWLDFTYQPGDLMLNGQTASSPTQATEELTIGVMNLSFDGGLNLQDAFCVDRFSYISNGNYQVNFTPANSIANGDRAAWLLHDVLPQINAATGLDQRNLAAALQMAIWDVVHDNGDGFSLGRIQMSSHANHPTDSIILNLAQSFVGQSNGQAYSNALVINDANLGSMTQRQMIDQPGSGVPEPSTWALALTGLAFAAIRRIKRF